MGGRIGAVKTIGRSDCSRDSDRVFSPHAGFVSPVSVPADLWRIGGNTCGAKTGRRAARFSASCEKHAMSDNVCADAEARQRAASEFATTFLVEAGAGTGKTTVLLSRLLALVRSGRSRVDRLAAIT